MLRANESSMASDHNAFQARLVAEFARRGPRCSICTLSRSWFAERRQRATSLQQYIYRYRVLAVVRGLGGAVLEISIGSVRCYRLQKQRLVEVRRAILCLEAYRVHDALMTSRGAGAACWYNRCVSRVEGVSRSRGGSGEQTRSLSVARIKTSLQRLRRSAKVAI